MIHAEKGGLLGGLWSAYVDWRLGRTFRGVWLDGEVPSTARSLLFYSNHPSWWDGFAFFRLARAHGLEGYCLMEEQNLAKYRFLRRLGAFSIRRGDSHSALETIRYATDLLAPGRRAVVMFPQGVLTVPTAPLVLERGIEVFARASHALCVPLALRYEFFDDPKPDLVISVGQAHESGPLSQFASGLKSAVDRVRAVTSPSTTLIRLGSGIGVREAVGLPALRA